VPFGVMAAAAAPTWSEYRALADAFDSAVSDAAAGGGAAADSLAGKIREFIADKWKVDPRIAKDIIAAAATAGGDSDDRIMVRSSANVEDLEGMSGAGLYDSIANVPAKDPAAIAAAVSAVWGSLWTKRAALSRRAAGVPHAMARMGILVQRMVPADIAFVAFSDNPISRDPGQVYMELCVGMGETLASAGQAGTPYRAAYSKKEGRASTLALSSLSYALRPSPDGTAEGKPALVQEAIDYTAVPFHTDAAAREAIVARIAKAVVALAEARGSPQDVEGVVRAAPGGGPPRIYIVQARPMVLAAA